MMLSRSKCRRIPRVAVRMPMSSCGRLGWCSTASKYWILVCWQKMMYCFFRGWGKMRILDIRLYSATAGILSPSEALDDLLEL